MLGRQDTRVLHATVVVAGALFVVTAATASAAPDDIYKWVDDQGVVHYGDRVPPKYAKKRHEVMNSQGMTVDVLPSRKATAQSGAQMQLSSAERNRHQRDHMLLTVYGSIEAIKHARESHIKAVKNRIGFIKSTTASLTSRLKRLKKQARRRDASAAKANTGRITRLKKRLHSKRQALVEKQAEIAAIKKQYAAYIDRFREIEDNTP